MITIGIAMARSPAFCLADGRWDGGRGRGMVSGGECRCEDEDILHGGRIKPIVRRAVRWGVTKFISLLDNEEVVH